MNAIRRHRKLVVVLATVAVASVLIGAVRFPTAAAPEAIVASTPAARSMTGVATGEFERRLPVYRLPSIDVTVTRSEALARMAREDALARK